MLKTRFIWTLLVLLLIPLPEKAQSVDSTNYMFAALPDALFPDGFLHDQSAFRAILVGTDKDLDVYDGSIPGKITNRGRCEALYKDLYLSQRLASNGLLFGNTQPYLKSYEDFLKQSTAKDTLGVDISLYLNWFNVHTLDTNALSKGWLDFDGIQYKLMPSKMWLDAGQQIAYNTPNPMDSARRAIQNKSVFFGGTNSHVNYIKGTQTSLTFSLQDYLVQSNKSLPSKFYIDLDDGNGFQQVYLNQKITANYSTTASYAELEYKDLAIRVRDGKQWIETRFRIPLIFNVIEPDEEVYTNNLPSPSCYPTTTPENEARITVKYANKGLGFQKPLILVEGFESSSKDYGFINYESLSSGVVLNANSDTIFHGMARLSWLYDSLHTSGYDLVHVDFKESKQSISDNMQSLIRALKWVSDQNPDQPSVVVGASMGGLIARAALLELERNDCCMNISAYGTFDTPHDGAFIPLGIQFGAKRMQEMTTVGPISLSNTWSRVINSPTALQMLTDHLNPLGKSMFAQLMAFYNNEQPKGIRRFAISNGSDMNVAAPLQDPDDVIADWGLTQRVPYKHRINHAKDSLLFNNRGGQRRAIIAPGGTIHGMGSSTNYLYFGQPIFGNMLNVIKLKGYSKVGARNALFVYRLESLNLISSTKSRGAIRSIQNKTNNALSKVHARIQSNANVLSKRSTYNDYIEVPGSNTSSADGFAVLPYAQLKSPTHTFIPAFSALDVGADYATQTFRGRMDIIPFHTYISPGLVDEVAGANQEHIYTDEAIINFALRNFESVHEEIGQNGLLKNNFNIAKEHNSYSSYPSHIKTLTVAASKTLSIGNQGVVGNSNIPADGNQDIEVFIGNGCTTGTLTVKGNLRIGDIIGDNATLRVNKGSTLVLAKNSSLFIGPGSRLILEKGAELIIESGATIDWDEGEIVVNGTINTTSGAGFAPTGMGTLTIDEAGGFTSNSSGDIVLSQSTLNVKSKLTVPNGIGLVSLEECSVKFFNSANMSVGVDFSLQYCEISYSGKKQWLGFEISNGTTLMKHCDFKGGNPAVDVAQNVDFTLENTSFNNALKGILCGTTPVSFYANSFSACGLGAYVNAGSTIIERNLFHANNQGLIFNGNSNNVQLELVRNVFTSNTQYGSSVTMASTRLECNEWSYNATGHYQQGGVLSMGGNAGNEFKSNTLGLSFEQLQGLSLNQGQNKWSGSANLDIRGSFVTNANLPYNGTHLFISADYNSFTNNFSTDMVRARDKVYPVKNPNTQPSSYICPAKGPGKAQSQGEEQGSAMSLTLFPNPSTSSSVQATFSPLEQNGKIEVYAASGALVQSFDISAGSHSANIQIANTPGSYVVRLIAGGRMETARWILL